MKNWLNMDIEKEYNSLIDKTINAYIKHFGLEVKDGFLYKGEWAVYTEPLERKSELLAFLEGISAVYDSKEAWFK